MTGKVEKIIIEFPPGKEILIVTVCAHDDNPDYAFTVPIKNWNEEQIIEFFKRRVGSLLETEDE